jgi:glycogen phosphorylase
VKQNNKQRMADYIEEKRGIEVNTQSMFDIQIKRIHEYKRQFMLALYAITQYNRIKANPDGDYVPRTILVAGKAAPGYTMAKLFIKLMNDIGEKSTTTRM